jgi:integrase
MRPARFERAASSAARGRLSPSEPARCCSKFLRHLIFNHSRTVSSRCTIRSLQYRDSDAARPLLRPAAHHPGHGAASHGKLAANPCNVKGVGNTKRVEKIRPASLPELEKITAEMPAQYAAMILLAAWCAMRFGELTELRRRDLVLDSDQGKGVIRIERAVVRTDGGSRPRRPRATPGLVMSPSRRT